MNIANLKVGMKIKNYPELCKLLGVQKKTGNSKKAQLTEIERFLKYEKEGNAFIIKEIYKTPRKKAINMRNTIYGDMMQLLIMDYLIQQTKQSMYTSRNNLLKNVNIVNENYSYCSSHVQNTANYMEIEQATVNDFFNITYQNFRWLVEHALSELDDKAIIVYEKIKIVNTNNEYRKANEEEIALIVETEREVLNKMGFKKKEHARISNKWDIFTQKVNSLLKKEKDINFYYSGYKITINQKHIDAEYAELANYFVDQVKRQQIKNQLIDTFCKQLIKNAAKRKINTQKNISTVDKRRLRARNNFTYILDFQKLTDLVISPKAGNKVNEIKTIKAK